eukprot:31191-Pelagococcus_subviridis.AAC.6
MFPFTRGVATSPGIGGALHVNDVSNVSDAEKHTLLRAIIPCEATDVGVESKDRGVGGERRREQKSSRIGVHRANAVVLYGDQCEKNAPDVDSKRVGSDDVRLKRREKIRRVRDGRDAAVGGRDRVEVRVAARVRQGGDFLLAGGSEVRPPRLRAVRRAGQAPAVHEAVLGAEIRVPRGRGRPLAPPGQIFQRGVVLQNQRRRRRRRRRRQRVVRRPRRRRRRRVHYVPVRVLVEFDRVRDVIVLHEIAQRRRARVQRVRRKPPERVLVVHFPRRRGLVPRHVPGRGRRHRGRRRVRAKRRDVKLRLVRPVTRVDRLRGDHRGDRARRVRGDEDVVRERRVRRAVVFRVRRRRGIHRGRRGRRRGEHAKERTVRHRARRGDDLDRVRRHVASLGDRDLGWVGWLVGWLVGGRRGGARGRVSGARGGRTNGMEERAKPKRAGIINGWKNRRRRVPGAREIRASASRAPARTSRRARPNRSGCSRRCKSPRR